MKKFANLFRWLNEEYNGLEVFITENGWSDEGQLDDSDRVEYLRSHLQELAKVLANNECNVTGYAGN